MAGPWSDGNPAKEAVAAALAEANAASVKAAQDADAALEAELFSRIR